MKGYPIGYIMLWKSPEDYTTMGHIGDNDKAYMNPDSLVIDGQQRLTALLAAIKGIEVKDKNYKYRSIRISYNPLTREFAVWTEAYERNPEWISEISTIFDADDKHNISKLRKQYIKDVNSAREKNRRPILTDDEEDIIEANINDLLNLSIYSLPTLQISAKANEEDVAEIFVRVNSGGQTLTEKNFIETLLAVYDNDIYNSINNFCEQSRIPKENSSYNFILEVDPSHLIRVAVAVGFRRARLRYAYMLLRGKDLETGVFSTKEREANLLKFKNSLALATNLNNWHAFLGLYAEAGYVTSSFIASSNSIVFCYVLYLIGKYTYNVSSGTLNKIITKWIFMSTITQYYTGSTETEVEKQLADLRRVYSSEDYVRYLDRIINSRFTEDYFTYTLPSDLASASARSPAWFGYTAALNVLGTPMLFSTTTLALKLLPGASGTKKAIDKHHIFPKNYLAQIGFPDDRDRNQIANFTYLDYTTNIDISDDPPADYAARYRQKLGQEEFEKACLENAIPPDFDTLPYPEFLEKRRKLMAGIVKKAFLKLCHQ